MLTRARMSACMILVLSLLPLAPASGQTMQDVLGDLFVFGSGDDPLFLIGTAGQEATAVHGSHFIPSSSETNGALLSFFTSSVALNVANFPLSSTAASQTFKFVDGVPTPTSNSFGPIFAERAQTIGRGRVNAGVNYSKLAFKRVRGVDLSDVQLVFLHQNADFEGCDEIFGEDCTLLGVPPLENDIITLDLNLDMNADVFAFYGTFGLTDWLDLSLALPVINFDMRGSSVATVIPTSDPAVHFFGGTQEDPALAAEKQTFGSATGIGDIVGRVKALIIPGENWDFGVLAEVQAPTGREEDFLGTGKWNAKGLVIISGTFSDFAPHANVGYEYRGSDLEQDVVEVIAGFDQRLASWATLAIDLLGGFRVGDQKLKFPEDVHIQAPFERTVRVTNIPDRNDDILDGSLGFKFRTGGGLIIITNVLVPLNDGGLRSGVIPTLGLEYTI